MASFRHILAATDFSECSAAAIDYATDIAKRYEATLTAMHAYHINVGYYPMVPGVGELMSALEDAAQVEIAKVLETVHAQLPAATGVVRCGAPADQILDVAQAQRADLIVVGSHGRRGLSRAMLGSVAERVVRLASVPVLTVHGPGPSGGARST